MKQNLVSLNVNIARAYEIASAGNHTMKIIPSKDEDCQQTINQNVHTLANFYGVSVDGYCDIVIELHKINANNILLSLADNSPMETLEDIAVRIEECRKSDKTPAFVLNEPNKSLLKTAIDRLNLSIEQVRSITAVAITIAKLSNAKEVKLEHLAEAIQYQSAQNNIPVS